MKKWWMWWMVGLLGMVGCNASEQERMIGPYSLNEQEERIMNLTATAPGAVQVFQVTPEQGTIDVKIDHYQAGQHQGIQLTGSKLSLGKDGLVSFGLRELSKISAGKPLDSSMGIRPLAVGRIFFLLSLPIDTFML
jgi:hypothetical protein